MENKLKELQSKCDKLYAENGLTDEVLDLQVEINQLRHEHDITDESEFVFEDFVQ